MTVVTSNAIVGTNLRFATRQQACVCLVVLMASWEVVAREVELRVLCLSCVRLCMLFSWLLWMCLPDMSVDASFRGHVSTFCKHLSKHQNKSKCSLAINHG